MRKAGVFANYKAEKREENAKVEFIFR